MARPPAPGRPPGPPRPPGPVRPPGPDDKAPARSQSQGQRDPIAPAPPSLAEGSSAVGTPGAAAQAELRPRGAPAPDPRRLRRKGQDPTLDRGVDAKEMWRIFRIISEFVEAIDGLRDIRPAISVWGSARTGRNHTHYRMALETARELSSLGYTVITGGGPGIMEAANKGARKGGGKSVGLGIRLPFEQSINGYCDVAIEFEYFFIRKMMFTKYAAGLLVAPGGFGTMDEMFDTLTLIQTRKIRRIPVVLLGKAYYGPLVAWMRDTMLAHGNIDAEDLDLWLLTDSPKEAARYLDRHIVDQTWWSQPLP